MIKILCVFALMVSVSLPVQAAKLKYMAMHPQLNAKIHVIEKEKSKVVSSFSQATSDFTFDTTKQAINKLRLSLPTETLDRALRNLLDAGDYPEIIFIASAASLLKDGKAEIKGMLTVHGINAPAIFAATLTKGESSKQINLLLQGTFKRTDFGINSDQYDEEVTLNINMNAMRLR